METSWFKVLVIIILIILLGLLIAYSVFFALIGMSKIITSTAGWVMFSLSVIAFIILFIVVIIAIWKAMQRKKSYQKMMEKKRAERPNLLEIGEDENDL